jgi:hypothetical protein
MASPPNNKYELNLLWAGGDFNSLSVTLQTDRQRIEIGGLQLCQSSKHTYIHTHVCMHACMYVCVYVCMHVCTVQTTAFTSCFAQLERKWENIFIFCEVPNCIRRFVQLVLQVPSATAQFGPRFAAEAATYTTHNRRTSTPSARFEPANPAIERPQGSLDRTATRIGRVNQYAREMLVLPITN